MSVRNVYLINLSFGLAGTERRFANIWRTLRTRAKVRPFLVVPDTLAEILYWAKLADRGDDLLWTVPEPAWSRRLSRVPVPRFADAAVPWVRSRAVARRYAAVWDQIRHDRSAVIHVGLNCSALNPPDVPIDYECVDSLLTQLGSRHYVNAAARPSIIHCQTDRIRTSLERRNAYLQPKWTTITSPCYFARYPDEGVTSRRDPMLIAFVGRLAPEKNPLLFVDAIARLREAGLPVRALMLGEGPMVAPIRERIERLGLSGVIELGFSGIPLARLMESAVYVSLQDGDNYGSQSLLEAMGAGCAIVASDVGETARLVGDAVGLRVRLNISELTAALSSMLRNPGRTAAMGAAASQLARTEYTADTYVAFLESLYELAIEKHGSTAAASASKRGTSPVQAKIPA